MHHCIKKRTPEKAAIQKTSKLMLKQRNKRKERTEKNLQAEARNYRGGSEKHSKITRLDIVAKGTIDELVLVALQEKQDVSEVVLKYMKGNQK